jgi:hypothetical protein
VEAIVTTSSSGVTGPLRWAAINRPLDGELLSGDRHAIRATPHGASLVVIDGLGHGPEAAHAAAEAARVFESGAFGSVVEALRACHAALARTRGAVMSLVEVHGADLSWVGIGNVEAMLVRRPGATPVARARLVLSGGVVGHALSTPRVSCVPIARGDLLVLATDGLTGDVLDHVDALGSPERVVEGLMARCRTGRDDALVFAARYDGDAAP